jgi:hypothetical protein
LSIQLPFFFPNAACLRRTLQVQDSKDSSNSIATRLLMVEGQHYLRWAEMQRHGAGITCSSHNLIFLRPQRQPELLCPKTAFISQADSALLCPKT